MYQLKKNFILLGGIHVLVLLVYGSYFSITHIAAIVLTMRLLEINGDLIHDMIVYTYVHYELNIGIASK